LSLHRILELVCAAPALDITDLKTTEQADESGSPSESDHAMQESDQRGELYDAYDDLDAETRNFISDKRGIMQYHRRQELKARERKNDHPRPPLTEEQKAQTPDITQPMVRTHPVTGAKSLYVNETYTFGIDGMDEEEAKPILQRLYDHITAPERVYRHKWKVGDLVMWDNALMQHKAVTNYKLPQRRKLIRTSISGTEVF